MTESNQRGERERDVVQTRVEPDGLGDWRIQAVTHLAKDLPQAFPGGPSHKAGTPVYLTSVINSKEFGFFGFHTPSAAALSLDIALKAASRALQLRPEIISEEVIAPWGKGKQITIENLPTLYEYFQQCMIAVTFSFQALECFCNHSIARKMTGTITLARRRGDETLTAEEVERNISTEEKLATVLPRLLVC
jgi:hypothetical protein